MFLLGLAALLIVTWLVLVWVDARSKGNIRTGDTDNLVGGARRAIECVRDGTLVGCGRADGSIITAVGPYPLLQYLPTFLLVQFGLSDLDILRTLATVNLAAFAALFVMVGFAFRRQPALAALAAVAFLGGAGTFLATAAFGEMLAAAVVLAAVVAAIERRPRAIIVLFALACLAKETMPPFLFLLGVIAARDPRDGLLPARPVLVPLAQGVGLGVALSAGFNLFRFANLQNVFYLDPGFRTPGLGRKLEFLAAEWLAPTAGILWFWPAAGAILIGAVVFSLQRLRRTPRDWRCWAPTLALGGGVVVFTAGLAAWISPFGWIAYGPRLAAPLLPAAVVVALYVEREAFLGLLATGRRHLPAVVAGAFVVAAVGWPQFGVPWRYTATVEELIAPVGDCPGMMGYTAQDGPIYFRCTSATMWHLPPEVLGQAAHGGGIVADIGRAAAAEATLLLVLAAAANAPRRQRPTRHSTAPSTLADVKAPVTGVP